VREADAPADTPETAGQRLGFDTSMPNIARVYDYLLGGKDNFTADREAGDMVIAAYPGIVRAVKANRAFLGRAVRYLAGEGGIRQFLDIGPGIPTAGNTHEVAQSVAPASRVVYVDNDPVVLSHARALLRSSRQGTAAFVDADVRDIGKVVAEAGQLLDFSEPVAVVMLAVLHFLPDDVVYDTVSALTAALASGSFVAISHIAKDIEAESISEIIRNSREGPQSAQMCPRTRDEVTRLFAGLELVEPGVVALQDWRPDSDLEARNHAAGWAGVARKPLSFVACDSFVTCDPEGLTPAPARTGGRSAEPP
jgi:O-methyltransferase involved in polyketide biosynthesis